MQPSFRRPLDEGLRAERAARRFDLFAVLAAVALALTAAFAAYPAFRAGPPTLAGLVLLLGLGAVVLLGFYAFGKAGDPRVEDRLGERLIQAMDEPAALVGASGRVRLCNAAWRDRMGAAGRAKVIAQHDTAVLARETQRLYEELIEEKNAHRHPARR